MIASVSLLGPYARQPGPILSADPSLTFDCPLAGRAVRWAAKDVFNPGAIVRDGKVHLLVRAEDPDGRYAGTSRIGLATSADGITFALHPKPVLHPDDDEWQAWEWPGGLEDPRLVEAPDGRYVCTYTAFDGRVARLMVATSGDLRAWTKHGPAFGGTPYSGQWSKSGAILTEERDGRLVAAKVGGRYWMYWGEGVCFAATSHDLVRWEPAQFDATQDRHLVHTDKGWEVHFTPGTMTLRPLLFPRRGRFDSMLVEPGPPAVVTDVGIVLLYNGCNHPTRGEGTLAPMSYNAGHAVFDPNDPASVIARSDWPFLAVERPAEQRGQVDDVVFAQGLVLFRDRWHLYHGMADSRVGVAIAPR
jgi:predicted GH43/DUF377 family glycosyl hydrolase